MNLSWPCKARVLPLMAAATAVRARRPNPICVGVMTDMADMAGMTGMAGMTMHLVGPGSEIGTTMVAENFGGKAGARSIKMLAGDHQNKPGVGAIFARRWIGTEGVDAIVDRLNFSVALAVPEVTPNAKRMALHTARA